MTDRARRQGANSAPEMPSSTKLRAGSQLLTKSSWDRGWLTPATRSAPQRRHMAHLRWCSHCTHRTLNDWDRGGDKTHHPTWGMCAHQAPGRLSFSDLRRAQNAGPTESVPLWGTREPKPEQCRPGKCMQPRACLRQFLCRATWRLSSIDRESTHTCEQQQTQCGPDTASTPHTRQ